MKECANGTFWTYHFIHASGSERGANDVSDGYRERRDGSEGWLGDVLGDLTLGGDDVGLTDVLGLFRLDLGGGITGFGGGSLIFRHLNLESLIVL